MNRVAIMEHKKIRANTTAHGSLVGNGSLFYLSISYKKIQDVHNKNKTSTFVKPGDTITKP